MSEILSNIIKAKYGTIKPSYSFKDVLNFMKQVSNSDEVLDAVVEIPLESVPDVNESTKRKPSRFKKGDVFRGCSVNFKNRPFVIAKCVKDGYYCIPLTSSPNEFSTIPTTSRFFKGYLGNYMVFVKEEFIKKSFSGVLDDTRAVNKAIKVIAGNIQTNFL